jgi:hypothetical protein
MRALYVLYGDCARLLTTVCMDEGWRMDGGRHTLSRISSASAILPHPPHRVRFGPVGGYFVLLDVGWCDDCLIDT